LPSGSLAVAVIAIVAGAVKDVPEVARLMVGGWLVADCTVTLTALDVELPPSASWATAVSAYVPTVDAAHDTEYGAVVAREIIVEPE
jgi:hypothetical protein